MNKEDLLRSIADTGYNVGFGAKKHFATYDIVAKVPGLIGIVSMAVGVFALFIDALSAKHLSAAFIVLGVAGICISHYDYKKQAYADAGTELTKLFNRLKTLYFSVKRADGHDLHVFMDQLSCIEEEFNSKAMNDQILFSDWYAHYKFFWQHQIEWIDEQKHFKLFRDKVPLSFMLALLLLAIASGLFVCSYHNHGGPTRASNPGLQADAPQTPRR